MSDTHRLPDARERALVLIQQLNVRIDEIAEILGYIEDQVLRGELEKQDAQNLAHIRDLLLPPGEPTAPPAQAG